MRRTFALRGWIAALSFAGAATLAACSGGVSGLTPNASLNAVQKVEPVPLGSAGSKHHKLGKAQIIVKIPLEKKTRPRMRPLYISPSTRSMTVAIQGGSQQTFNLTPSSSGCSKNGTSGYRTCTIAMIVPSGQQSLTFTLYDATNGQGNPLSTATTSVTIAQTGFTPIPVILDGVIASAKVLIKGGPSGSVPVGAPTSVPVQIEAYDADNNLIVPPGNYSTPITLTNSDTSGTTSFAPPASSNAKGSKTKVRRFRPLDVTAVGAPGQTVTLYYNGYPTPSASLTITPGTKGFNFSNGAATVNFTGSAVTSYNVPASALAIGSDKALWFTNSSANAIGRLASDGTITEYSIPTSNAGPDGIAAGPDNALWFTEQCAGKIGRVTTGGVFTEYSVPAFANQQYVVPTQIAAGLDGALWFTDECASYIGRITTTGSISQTAATLDNYGPSNGPSTSRPNGLAAGPDGAMWFTAGVNAIGRITSNLVVSSFVIPSANSAGSITKGPDGALWFMENSAVGRMTTSGAVTAEYPITGSSGGFMNITTGSDGALWFTSLFNGSLNRITTDGVETVYPLPYTASQSQPQPYQITAGAARAIWLTDGANSVVDKVAF